MKHSHSSTLALLVMAALAAPCAQAQAPDCEQNFSVEGSWSSGRTFSTEAAVPGAAYPDALHRVRDKLVEQGLEVIAVQEKSGYIRAATAVKGGGGGTATAPLRGYVTPAGSDGVNVSLQFTIAGGQMTSKKAVMQHMCELVAAAAG